MQTPPITFIVCVVIAVLVLIFKDKFKRKNSPTDNIPEPYATILLVMALCACAVILTNISNPNYFSRPILDIARLLNFLGLMVVFYVILRRKSKDA